MTRDQAHGLRLLLSQPSLPQPAHGTEAGPNAFDARGRTLAVVSGKGGVGKTFVAASIAVLAARRGQRVVVVDGDLGLANADVVLGARPQRTIEDVLAGRCSLRDAITPGAEGVGVLAGGGSTALTQLDDDQQRALSAHIAELAQSYDLVVLDCGAGIGDNVVFLAGLADERLIVVTPEPTALIDAYAMAKALTESGQQRADVVVNCTVQHDDGPLCFGKLDAVADRFLAIDLRYAGAIPRDDVVRHALMSLRPVVIVAPRARVTQALARLERKLASTAQLRVDRATAHGRGAP